MLQVAYSRLASNGALFAAVTNSVTSGWRTKRTTVTVDLGPKRDDVLRLETGYADELIAITSDGGCHVGRKVRRNGAKLPPMDLVFLVQGGSRVMAAPYQGGNSDQGFEYGLQAEGGFFSEKFSLDAGRWMDDWTTAMPTIDRIAQTIARYWR